MEDRVALITGASSGIGAAVARAAAGAGMRVVLAARRAERLEALADETGGIAVRADVGEWADNVAAVDAALDAFGRLDVVVANAGHGAKQGWLEDTPERWRSMVLTNVLGSAYTVRAALPAITEARGHVVVMGSVGGRRVRPGSFYSCTKWTTTAMGEALRQDLHGTGVRVTVVEPGTTETEFFGGEPRPGFLAPADIAAAVLYALSQPPHVDVNEVMVRSTQQVT